jgi:hypothetical protein
VRNAVRRRLRRRARRFARPGGGPGGAFEQYENGNFVQLSALGVLMIVLMSAIVAAAQRLGAQVGVDTR